MMDVQDAIEHLLNAVHRNGIDEAEIVAAEDESLEAGVRLGQTEKLLRSRERRIAVRIFDQKSSAICSTADLSPTALDTLVDQCRNLARATAPDPYSGLKKPDHSFVPAPDLELYDSNAEAYPAEAALEIARRAESAALDLDPRITNSEGAEFVAGKSRFYLANTHGFQENYSSTSFSIMVIPVASANGSMQQDSWHSVARWESDLESPESIGRRAAERTLRRLGARCLATREAPVIFEAPVAGSLVSHLANAVSGTSIYRGLSFLGDRRGTQVAPKSVSIVDDACIPRFLGSRPFDGEGSPTRQNLIVKNGSLQEFLLDSYSAQRLDLDANGCALRGIGEPPSAGASNFHLHNGETTPTEMLKGLSSGLLVTGLSGFGINPVTGDYSRGASGLWIENGEPAYPVEEITIAGNLLSMFQTIEAVGNDLEIRGRIASPSLLIGKMTIAGEG